MHNFHHAILNLMSGQNVCNESIRSIVQHHETQNGSWNFDLPGISFLRFLAANS